MIIKIPWTFEAKHLYAYILAVTVFTVFAYVEKANTVTVYVPVEPLQAHAENSTARLSSNAELNENIHKNIEDGGMGVLRNDQMHYGNIGFVEDSLQTLGTSRVQGVLQLKIFDDLDAVDAVLNTDDVDEDEDYGSIFLMSNDFFHPLLQYDDSIPHICLYKNNRLTDSVLVNATTTVAVANSWNTAKPDVMGRFILNGETWYAMFDCSIFLTV